MVAYDIQVKFRRKSEINGSVVEPRGGVPLCFKSGEPEMTPTYSKCRMGTPLSTEKMMPAKRICKACSLPVEGQAHLLA